ncbi:MAG TPA: hypothetical protein VKG43_05015 [Acidimicrobiales bacterium]|nr:hypothetical protein [Acidimicrobiales bacterium]
MIEVVSHPADLTTWDQDAEPFYLELFGETQPLLDMAYAEAFHPRADGDTEQVSGAPVYEYWWTIGHGGHGPEQHHLWSRRAKGTLWTTLANPAARVYLYFPIHGGWRIKEVVATVKYLSPVQDQKTWSEKAAAEWRNLEPVMQDAGSLAASLRPIPGVGMVAAGAAPVLTTLSKLRVNSVPQGVDGFEWYVDKVTFGSPRRGGVYQGVSWTLPPKMVQLLGGRLTGSIAISFVPSRRQAVGGPTWAPTALPVLAHAAVYADGETVWVPADNQFVELVVAPRVPSTSPPDGDHPNGDHPNGDHPNGDHPDGPPPS